MMKDNLIYNLKDDLYTYKSGGTIDYADNSEDFFIDLFSKIDDVKPYDIKLQEYIKDWATKYHLSYIRTNLLDSIQPLLMNNSNKVLELGGGMGALTPWLSNNFKNVDVIEGSFKRAKALRLRTKFMENVRVFVGDIASVEYPEENYDLITLIGVLEYIPFYNSVQSPRVASEDFLSKVSSYLNQDGILAIAIENKLGAKYFSGCTEDHNGQLFSGIMDYPFKSPITFSRNELEEMLKKTGFSNIQFYHVFPDYKLPQLFFREDPKVYETSPAIFAKGISPDYSGKREYFFMEQLFLDSLYQAKLLHHFSNSFLVLCSKSENVNLKTDWLIKKYWNRENTRPEFHHCMNFIQKNNELWVERKSINSGRPRIETGHIKFQLESHQFIYGKSLTKEIYQSLFKEDGYASLIQMIKTIRQSLLHHFSLGALDSEGYSLVSGKAVDYCFWNLIETSTENFQFIDTKWEYKVSLTEDFVLFRNLLGLCEAVYAFIEEDNFSEFIIPIMKNIFPNYCLERLNDNLLLEQSFEKQITMTHDVLESNVVFRKSLAMEVRNLQQKCDIKCNIEHNYNYWLTEEKKFLVALEGRLNDGATFLWGAGNHTVALLMLFERIKFGLGKIAGIIDSDPAKDYTFINGIRVLYKEKFLKSEQKNCTNIIISSKSFEEEIFNELKTLLSEKINIIRLYDGNFNTELINL